MLPVAENAYFALIALLFARAMYIDMYTALHSYILNIQATSRSLKSQASRARGDHALCIHVFIPQLCVDIHYVFRYRGTSSLKDGEDARRMDKGGRLEGAGNRHRTGV